MTDENQKPETQQERGINLGYPLKSPFFSEDCWCLVIADGNGNHIPVAYTKDQALEIAKRIMEYYSGS